MATKFELNFRGNSDDGKDYGCGMTIDGDYETIGKLFADYCLAESRAGHNEPMIILIAAFKEIQKLTPDNGAGKIIKPNFSN